MKFKNMLFILICGFTIFNHSTFAQGGSSSTYFDGSNDYLSLGGSYYQYDEFTTEMWVYATDWTPAATQILITTNTNGEGQGWKIELRTSDVRFYLDTETSNSKSVTISTSTFNTGWHHIAASYDGSNINLWIDGYLNATTTQTGEVDYTPSQTTIIGTHSDFTADFDGYMDEIRFWNVALSQSQIQEWMNQPITSGIAPANVTNLRGYYKLDTDWPTSPNELDDSGNDVGGGASDRDLTNNGCSFSDNKTPIGEFTSGYTTDVQALWRAQGTNWSDESTGLALQDWDAHTVEVSEFYAFANNGETGTSTSDLPADISIRAATIWFLNDVANDRSNWQFTLDTFGAASIEESGLDASNYKLLKRNGTTGDFEVVASGTSISSGVVTFIDYLPSGDAYYTIGRYSNPVPVELTTFTATVNDNSIVLNWQTATEVNNYGFEIQRTVGQISNLPLDWENIAFVEGHGNSNSPKNYSFVDADNLSGTLQYRLKQIDNGGGFEYSDVVEVKAALPLEYKLAQNYPNPFNPSTTISFALPKAGNVSLKIYNTIGEEVAELVNKKMNAGVQTINFDASHLSSGLYFYRISADNFVNVKKMMLIK